MIQSRWWKKKLSNILSLPSKEDIKIPLNINFGNKEHNNIYCEFYKFKNEIINNTKYKHYEIDSFECLKTILKKGYISIKKVKDDNTINDKKKEVKIKTIKTKTRKKGERINTCTKAFSYRIYPNDKQKLILHKWFNESDIVYNKCVDLFNNNDKNYNNKLKIFELLYGNNVKPAPYDMLTDEVKKFNSNLKSCYSNLKNGNITHFKMKHKSRLRGRSVMIPLTSVKTDGFYKDHLGKMKGLNLKNVYGVQDSRVIYDKLSNKYFVSIPKNIRIKTIENRQPFVAMDPGEKIFQSFYGSNGYGNIGKDIRNKILKEEKKIRRFQRILSKGKNKRGKKLNRRNVKRKIQLIYAKIKNIVKDLHNKAALYFCRNYDNIIIPELKTQKIVRKKRNTKKYLNEIKEKQGEEACKKELRRITKKKVLNGRVKFVLMMLSHYKFRQHLKNKCLEYGCHYINGDESYTSLTCTKCGYQSNVVNKKRMKTCQNCNYEIDRDVGGSRNICIKNHQKCKAVKPRRQLA